MVNDTTKSGSRTLVFRLGNVRMGTPGPIGPMGPEGIEGPMGLPGHEGLDGSDGTDGTRGLPGLPGAPGVTGTHGTNGVDGTDGVDGADGGATTLKELTDTPADYIAQAKKLVRVNAAADAVEYTDSINAGSF